MDLKKPPEEKQKDHEYQSRLEHLVKQRTDELEELNKLLQEEIARRNHVEGALREALEESRIRRKEVSALLRSSRAVLKYASFKEAARVIYESCRDLLGASAGYISYKNDNGENKAVYLDTGDYSCTVDPLLSVPIRGLREISYKTGKAVCCNDLPNSKWAKFIPEGHIALNNVLHVPLIIQGETVGLLALANKPGGFNRNDLRIVNAFSKDAAMALYNSYLIKSLKYSEEHFRSVAQSAGDAIITINNIGNIVFWNSSAELIFGYTYGEAVGSPLSIIIPRPLLDRHLAGIKNAIKGHARSSGKTLETFALNKGGKEIPVEISLSMWESRGKIYFSAIIRDITNRIKIQKEMDRLDRLNLVGQLAAGIGHEIRNPMTAVRGFLQLLTLKEDCSKYREYFDLMVGELDRANSIITEFLSMARNRQSEMEFQNINKIITAMEPLIAADAMHSNKYMVFKLETVPEIYLNEKEIRQLVLNLVRNGFDAMQSDGTLTIRTFIEGDKINLSVQDQGSGIRPEVLEKIGTPFFTTKDNGTGLGLAVCYSIAARHNATIDIETGDGGTTFTVRFSI